MRHEVCLCFEIEQCRNSLAVGTRIVIVMHHRELPLTTNTGHLASLVLKNCEIRLRGMKGSPLDPTGIIEEARQPLLLYPYPTATLLDQKYVATLSKPVTLIVPDGSWRQAAKMAKRELFLQSVPRVTLALGPPSQYQLRNETKPGGLATFEAIARSLGLLEGAEVQSALEKIFQLMVTRTLKTRGVCQ